MADSSLYGVITALIVAAGGVIVGIVGSNQSRKANEKVADRNAQATEANALLVAKTASETARATSENNVASESIKAFSEQLKATTAHALAIEASLRAEITKFGENLQRANDKITELQLNMVNLTNDKVSLQRENEYLHEQMQIKERRIDSLLITQNNLSRMLDESRGKEWREEPIVWVGMPEQAKIPFDALDRISDERIIQRYRQREASEKEPNG
jgi:seryl-tRNA synthetase